jgi:hypothetical protein
MCLAGAVAGQHGSLLVDGRGSPVCGACVEVSLRRGPMSALGSLQ